MRQQGRRSRKERPAGVVACLAALLALTPLPAAAQDPPAWVYEVRVGASSPKGALGDVADGGRLLAGAVGYRLLPRLTLRGELALEDLTRGGAPGVLGGSAGPDVELWHYMGVASLELTDPVRSRWEIVVHGGAGGTLVDASGSPTTEPFDSHEPTVLAAVDGGYDFSRHVTLFVRADGYVVLGDSADSGRPFPGEDMVLTHTAGLRLSF